ncbi:HNH endonuclease [Anaerolineales bacterium HSG24]|nr:HNH endonuclease [Anaerolineales bacterium HSG24]
MKRTYISAQLDAEIRQVAQNRCGYCLHPQYLVPDILQIEHIIPLSKGGSNEVDNLWLACARCNRYKSNKTVVIDPQTNQLVFLFNPRIQNWFDHFEWSSDGIRVIGLTAIGRATVACLQLDSDPIAMRVRQKWVEAGWHPPTR